MLKLWTKSGYLESREAAHRDAGTHAAVAARQDLAAVEAFGVEWLPEEPELPGQIFFGADDGRLFRSSDRRALGTKELQAIVALWNDGWGPEGKLRKHLEGVLGQVSVDGARITQGLARAIITKPWEGSSWP